MVFPERPPPGFPSLGLRPLLRGSGGVGDSGFMDRRLSRFPPSASAGGGTGFGLHPYRNPAEWPKVCPPPRLGRAPPLVGGVLPLPGEAPKAKETPTDLVP